MARSARTAASIDKSYTTKRAQKRRRDGLSLRRAGMPQGFHRHHEDRHGAVPHRPAQVAAGLPSDGRQQERRLAPTSCTACSASATRPLGSWPTASARPCVKAASRPMGGGGKVVEADETYFGNSRDTAQSVAAAPRPSLHQRRQERPRQQACHHRPGRARRPRAFLFRCCCRWCDRYADNVARERRLHTDESRLYRYVCRSYAKHETVKPAAPRSTCVAMFLRIPSRATFRFSSGVCGAFISIAARSICIGIWRSSISVTTTGSGSASTMGNVRRLQSRVRLASVSRIGG